MGLSKDWPSKAVEAHAVAAAMAANALALLKIEEFFARMIRIKLNYVFYVLKREVKRRMRWLV
jgi:hypothetical protein